MIELPTQRVEKICKDTLTRVFLAGLILVVSSLPGAPAYADAGSATQISSETAVTAHLEIEPDGEFGFFERSVELPSTSGLNLNNVIDQYHEQDLRIKRLSTTLRTASGSLVMGRDWSNFQDTIADTSRPPLKLGNRSSTRSVANQIKWLSPNGFSIALEEQANVALRDPGTIPQGGESDGSPSIILSWGGTGSAVGEYEYKVTAMGTHLDAGQSGPSFDGEDVIGWGLNLEGGWQIGDLFAALSVTFGKGIDSYLLRRFGNEIVVTPNQADDHGLAYSIRPSLYYSLNGGADFHVALGRYDRREDGGTYDGIDTLDTIHMGYNWNPWPSTRFGLELVGQNAGGVVGSIDDTQVIFEAQTNF